MAAMLISAEALPPRHAALERFIQRARSLAEVTDVLQVPDCPGGLPRVSALAGTAALRGAGLAVMPTLTPRDRGEPALRADLRAHLALGVDTVLAISGDRGAEDVRTLTVRELVQTAVQEGLRAGVTVAPGASDLQKEFDRALGRARAGAAFALTQYLFTRSQTEDFIRAWNDHPVSRELGLVAGTGPVSSRAALERIRRLAAVSMPDDFHDRVAGAADPAAEAAMLHLECVRALTELKGLRGIHFYTPHGDISAAVDGARLARELC